MHGSSSSDHRCDRSLQSTSYRQLRAYILSNGWTLDMEQVTKYSYMRWISVSVR